jgi:solute carrier family 34 (sodium-dependent phosphate cotransporter)
VSEPYERALAAVRRRLEEEFGENLLGVLLAGSYAYGEPMATSDLDLTVVVDEPWWQRRNLVVEGMDVELFIKPPQKLSGEILEAGATTDAFARGRIVHDPAGVVAGLVAEAKSVEERPRPIPVGDELELLRYRVTDSMKDAYDLVESKNEGFDIALFEAMRTTLGAYYQLVGRRMPKEKHIGADLRAHEPGLADVLAEIVDSRLPRDVRWSRLNGVAREILDPVGGPIVESETTPERVVFEPVVTHVEGIELPSEDVVVRPEKRLPLAARAGFLVLGLGLFVVALGLMKAGAAALAPSLRGSVFTDNAWSTLGLGWLGACIVLSGSPVAASALTLLDGGSVTRTQAFTMLTGSRIGAAFVVLVAGAVYAMRKTTGSGRRAPISIGILSLLTTMVIYVPGAIVGYLMLSRGALDGLGIGTSPRIASMTDVLFGWAVDLVKTQLPGWTLFPIGVIVLLIGFNFIDKVMPAVGSHEMEHRPDGWYTRKWPMFLLGCGVCMLTLSVSVALTVLVPLVAKGYLRRANTIPYIAGANITTLADTLVAAILIGNQDAVRVVVAVTVSVTVLTLFVLTFLYGPMRKAGLGLAARILGSRMRLAAFVAALFVVPIFLIAI